MELIPYMGGKIMKKIPVVLLLTMLLSLCLYGEKNNDGNSSTPLYKPTETSDIWLDINRLSGIFRNNGIWHFDVVANTQGTEWPKGSGNSPIYAGGQWVAASVNGEIRVAGIQHSATEFQAGMVLAPGSADNPRDPKYKWYELRSDGTGDWDNWPVDQGAPVDSNGNPFLLGDQTIFSVWNDLGDHAEYGTNKLSVEVQQTAFAFNRADALGDMHFIKWLMVNKSGEAWDSTYFSIWLDPDLGDASDDLVGCDTTLGLGFTYNANNSDQTYGAAPPAQGIDFFQGPIVDEVGSTVTLPNGTVLQDKTMRKMTSFVFYDNNDSNSGNPSDGGDVWGYMRGFWRDGTPITFGDRGSTAGNPATSFMFPGDPETEQSTGWLDYNADDRRFLMTTGPFPMPAWVDDNGNGIPEFGEPGVQEIVAGVILGKGTDNLNSVSFLKAIDAAAQAAYELDFKLPPAPSVPNVSVAELNKSAVLTWDDKSEFLDDGSPFEADDIVASKLVGQFIVTSEDEYKEVTDGTFNFARYSVYQYSDASGSDPVLYARFGTDKVPDPMSYTGQRFVQLDVNKNTKVGNSGPLVNGKEYYFGVQAEAYCEFAKPSPYFLSAVDIQTIVPKYLSGTSYSAPFSDTLEVTHSLTDPAAGFADANVIVRIIEPDKVTGDDYRVFFDQVSYFRDFDGTWKPTGGGQTLLKPSDLTGSTLIPTAVLNYDFPGTVDLNFEFSYASPDGNWCDGVQIELPAGININFAEDTEYHGGHGSDPPTPTIDGQLVTWGVNDTTQDGGFAGTEILTINVDVFTPPITVDYELWDDGWAGAGGIVNIDTSCVVDTIHFAFKTELYMNAEDVTTGNVVLDNSLDIFPAGTDLTASPGAIVDGMQIIVSGSFAAPTTIGSVEINGVEAEGDGAGSTYSDGTDNWSIIDYSWFGLLPTSMNKNGYGSVSVADLQQDYEFRFTGELDSTTINGHKVYITKDGTGSMATFYGARQYDYDLHPLNPTGTQVPFLVRVPFEVWNVDLGIQVNYQVYDRNQADPAAEGFYVWNNLGRMYSEVSNTPYDDTQPLDPAVVGDSYTWNHVWYASNYTTGDVVTIKYDNPLKLGLDQFTFTTAGMEWVTSNSAFKSDMNKIKVVPNPYYGYHSGEADPFNRWVQFTYLPPTCTVRIFDLAGNLVRKLEKNDPATPFLQWDMKNEYELPVASGIYIFHVDAEGIGEKIGKIAIFTPNERLDTW